jgi:PAS domain S-box-containing protein
MARTRKMQNRMQERPTQPKQAKEPLQEGQAQTEALYQISRRLSVAQDEQELLQVLSWPAIEAGALSTALIYVDLDDSGELERLELVATWGQWDVGFPTAEGSHFSLAEFPVSRLWLDNPHEAQLIADVNRDARVDESSRQMFTRIGARATVIIPLNHSGRWVGVLFFTWAEPHAFSRQETAIYHALTGLATGAVESRRLVESLEQAVKERTAELQESQQVLSSILDNIPLRVFWKDRDLNYLGCNRAFASDAGLDSCDWVTGKDDFEVNLPEHAERYRRDDLQVLASGTPKLNYVEPQTRPNGSQAWVETSKVPLRDETGAVWGILGVYGDITERKQAEAALKESERLLRTIAANYPAYLSIVERGEEGMTVGFTSGKEFARQNLDPNSFIGLTLEEVFGEQTPIVREHYSRAFRGEEVSFELFINDQHQLYNVVPLYDGDEVTSLLAVVENVTERVQAEEALRHARDELEHRVQERTAELQAQYARLDAILHNSADGIVVADRAGNIIQTNRVAQEWLTRTLPPADAGRLRQAIQVLAQQAGTAPELVLELEALDLELSAAPVVEDGVQEPAAAVVSIHDVSHLKAIDRMRTTFITNISHELRTPVTTIQAYAYLIQKTSPEDAKWNQYMQTMLQEVDRQVQLVKDILCISRIYAGRAEIVPRPTSLNELTEAAVAAHRSLAQERELVMVHRPVDPAPLLLVDPQQMMLVLNNLVDDAIRYTQAGGRVVVSTGQAEAEGRVWATVTVSDTGERIPAEDLLHIFERFFREEEPRSTRVFYTGLRLMILWEIVTLHDGWVTVESGEREGTTFTVWLPLPDQ